MNIEIEHYGGARRTLSDVYLDTEHREVGAIWKGRDGFEWCRVFFDLDSGLLFRAQFPNKQGGARDWRLTKESLQSCREAAGLHGPGRLHWWDVKPRPVQRKPKESNPRQGRLF